MKALIDPTQNNRIVEIHETGFDVAEPFFWKTCSKNVTPQTHLYVNDKFVEFDVNNIIAEISIDNSLLSSYKDKLLEDPRYVFSHLNEPQQNSGCC
jgi:hypothetical protein